LISRGQDLASRPRQIGFEHHSPREVLSFDLRNVAWIDARWWANTKRFSTVDRQAEAELQPNEKVIAGRLSLTICAMRIRLSASILATRSNPA
jgi:hypothetical protein